MSARELVSIASDNLSAAIDPFGAELVHLRDAEGRELMSDGDPAFWSGHAPLLFPIVGRLNDDAYRLDGTAYPMPQHGFARRMAWEVIASARDRAAFRLTDTDATRAVYPFAFELVAEYALAGAQLSIDVTVANRDTRAMPASFGFHPAFAWPLPYGRPRDAHRLTFARAEPAGLARLHAGLVLPERVASPLDGRELPLSDAVFANDALVWESVESTAVRYGADTGPALEIGFPDTPMLGVWSKPGARFVCVEPWHGIADPAGFDGDIRDKPGMMSFAPGAARTFSMRVRRIA